MKNRGCVADASLERLKGSPGGPRGIKWSLQISTFFLENATGTERLDFWSPQPPKKIDQKSIKRRVAEKHGIHHENVSIFDTFRGVENHEIHWPANVFHTFEESRKKTKKAPKRVAKRYQKASKREPGDLPKIIEKNSF